MKGREGNGYLRCLKLRLGASGFWKMRSSAVARRMFLAAAFLGLGEEYLQARTLYFPRRLTPAEMVTTGVALVNPTSGSITVAFRLQTVDGAVLTTAQRALPAQGQLALTINEVFPGAATAGWITIDGGDDRVHGFWLGGDFLSSTDGAPLLTSSDAGPYPAFTYIMQESEISFANIGSAAVTGNVHLNDENGTLVRREPFILPSMGLIQQPVASLFPAYAAQFNSRSYWISIVPEDPGASLLGTAVTTNGSADNNAVTNATYWSRQRVIFPQIVEGRTGGAAYSTLLVLANTREQTQDVTLVLRTASGAPLSVNRTIPAYGILRSTVTELFSAPSVEGWLSVEATDGVVAWASYTDVNGGGRSVVQGLPEGDTDLIFGHIADLSPWWTGIALANPSATDAQLEIFSIDSSGNLIGGPAQSTTARFVLAAGTKRAFLLGEVTPQTQRRSRDGGFIYVRSTNGVQVYGLELFFLRNGRVYSNVPAIRLQGLGLSVPGDSSASVSLTVTKSGLGSGRVTSNPAGINCSGSTGPIAADGRGGTESCTASYASGTQVTLTATAYQGSSFTGWSGACTGTATCVLTMDAEKSVSANFVVGAIQLRRLTVVPITLNAGNVQISGSAALGSGNVRSSPEGIDCSSGSSCTADFPASTVVTLTAAAASGFVFSSWESAACASEGGPRNAGGPISPPTCTLVMNADTTVRVSFRQQTFNLHVNRIYSGGGSLTVTSEPRGISCPSFCDAQFPAGTVVTLTAVPSRSAVFNGWSSECLADGTTCTVLMDSVKRVSAYYGSSSPPPPPACASAPVTITVSSAYGVMTALNIQGIGTWVVPNLRTVVVPDVPRGVYTLTIWTTAEGMKTQSINVGCVSNLVIFR